MPRLWPALVLLAAGCAAPEPSAPLFRNLAAPVGSQTGLAAARMAGPWFVAASFGPLAPAGSTVIWPDPEEARPLMVVAEGPLPVEAAAPGRWREFGPRGEPRAFWVHWADSGLRTAVVGTPSGRHGWIMTRGPLSDDRRAAALEILSWYGYDAAALIWAAP